MSTDKHELAKELHQLQEKHNAGGDTEVVDKCIKLTEEVNAKKAVIKTLEKENKTKNDTISDLQKKLNEVDILRMIC